MFKLYAVIIKSMGGGGLDAQSEQKNAQVWWPALRCNSWVQRQEQPLSVTMCGPKTERNKTDLNKS